MVAEVGRPWRPLAWPRRSQYQHCMWCHWRRNAGTHEELWYTREATTMLSTLRVLYHPGLHLPTRSRDQPPSCTFSLHASRPWLIIARTPSHVPAICRLRVQTAAATREHPAAAAAAARATRSTSTIRTNTRHVGSGRAHSSQYTHDTVQ